MNVLNHSSRASAPIESPYTYSVYSILVIIWCNWKWLSFLLNTPSYLATEWVWADIAVHVFPCSLVSLLLRMTDPYTYVSASFIIHLPSSAFADRYHTQVNGQFSRTFHQGEIFLSVTEVTARVLVLFTKGLGPRLNIKAVFTVLSLKWGSRYW